MEVGYVSNRGDLVLTVFNPDTRPHGRDDKHEQELEEPKIRESRHHSRVHGSFWKVVKECGGCWQEGGHG
jgi:hypothetical protein